MGKGWVKVYRQLLENPIVTKDADHIAVWMDLMLNAAHEDVGALFKGSKIVLHPGQLITSAAAIADRWNIDKTKVQRVLKSFENDMQIAQQMSSQNRLITVCNWGNYQSKSATQNATQMQRECNAYINKNERRLIKIIKNNISRAYEGFIPHEDMVDKVLEALDSAANWDEPKNLNGALYSADDFDKLLNMLSPNDYIAIINRVLPHVKEVRDLDNYILSVTVDRYGKLLQQ